MTNPLPFRPGDWVVDQNENPAQVKAVYEMARLDGQGTEVLFDLIRYDRDGDKLGRVSPSMGGPRSFEPACSIEGWRRIAEPSFPISPQWVPDGEGNVVSRYWAGPSLPLANYVPRKRRGRASKPTLIFDEDFEKALKAIADGHNDPRALARSVLEKAKKD